MVSGGTVVRVSHYVIHERYNIPLRNNDIGILFLSRRLTLSNSVALAFIPAQGNSVPDGATVTHVGWGQTNVSPIAIISPIFFRKMFSPAIKRAFL